MDCTDRRHGCREPSTTQDHELSLSDVVLLLTFGSVHEVDGLLTAALDTAIRNSLKPESAVQTKYGRTDRSDKYHECGSTFIMFMHSRQLLISHIR